MRALQIAPEPFFSPRGTPFSVYYRVLVLSELGVKVDVLTYGQGEDVDLPGVRIVRIPSFGWFGPVKVGPSLLKFFLDGFLLVWALGLLIRNRYDFVQAHEESIFFCRFLKPLFRFKLVYDMHSSLPQQLVNFQFARSKALVGLFEKLEDGSLERADAVITICPALAEHAVARMPDARRHFLIENSIFDPVRLKNGAPEPAGGSSWRERIPRDRPIVAYAGTFESYQGLDILIPAFAQVVKTRPDAFLLLCGGSDAQVKEYRALAESHGLTGAHCLFTGAVPRPVARELTLTADLLMSPRTRGTNTPLKIYEQLASGVPLVATRIHSHTQVLNEDVCFLADPTAESMAEAIALALNDEERRRSCVQRAQQLYDERYSRPRYVQRIRELLDVLQ